MSGVERQSYFTYEFPDGTEINPALVAFITKRIHKRGPAERVSITFHFSGIKGDHKTIHFDSVADMSKSLLDYKARAAAGAEY